MNRGRERERRRERDREIYVPVCPQGAARAFIKEEKKSILSRATVTMEARTVFSKGNRKDTRGGMRKRVSRVNKEYIQGCDRMCQRARERTCSRTVQFIL